MLKFINKLAERYSDIYKIFFFIAAITLVVLQFPVEGKFKYEYQKGKPWMHEDLIAPFDYALLKTDEEIASEKAVALKSMNPYFSIDTKVKDQNIKSFTASFDFKWNEKYGDKNTNARKLNFKIALSILDSIYSKGIIQLNDTVETKTGDFVINVIKGNIAEEKELSEVFTIQTADDYIVTSLKRKANSIDKDLLTPLLENAISQNIFYDEVTTNKYKQNILNNISPTRGMVQKGENDYFKRRFITSR